MNIDKQVAESLKHASMVYDSAYLKEKNIPIIVELLCQDVKTSLAKDALTKENDWIRGAIIDEAFAEYDEKPISFSIDKIKLNKYILEIISNPRKLEEYKQAYKQIMRHGDGY